MYRNGMEHRLFVNMVRTAAALGVTRLDADALALQASDATGHEQWTGAQAAAVLGWDAPLPDDYSSRISFERVTTLRHLLSSERGNEFWRANPISLHLAFLLEPSLSPMRVRYAYTWRNKIRIHQ